MLTHRVAQFNAAPPHPGVRDLRIDQTVLLNERAMALARFDHLWLTLTTLGVAGVVAALFRVPLLDILGSWSSLQLLAAVLGCTLAGVLLHSEGQLEFLQFRWQIDELAIAPAVTHRWRRTTWLLACGAIVLALLLGGAVRFVPPLPPLVPVLNVLLTVLVLLTWLVVALVSLILFPFAWLIGLLRGNQTAAPAQRFVPPPLPPIQQTVSERPLLPALIFWGCVVLLLGLAVLRYVQQRYDVAALLGRWRGWRWIMSLWRRAVDDVRGWGELALQQIRRVRRERHVGGARRVPIRGNRAQLRALYRRMVRLGVRRGVQHQASHTPYEWSHRLGTQVPTVAEETRAFTDAYVAAEYGPAPPSRDEVHQARRWWRRIERVLLRRR
jgi:hypothetical protein